MGSEGLSISESVDFLFWSPLKMYNSSLFIIIFNNRIKHINFNSPNYPSCKQTYWRNKQDVPLIVANSVLKLQTLSVRTAIIF